MRRLRLDRLMTAFGEPRMTWPLAALWPVSVCGIGPQPPLSLDTLCRFRLPLCRSTGFLTSLLPPMTCTFWWADRDFFVSSRSLGCLLQTPVVGRAWPAGRAFGGTALRRADAARPARGRVRRRAVPAMLRWVLHPLGDGRRRSQLQLLQLRRRGDSLAPMTAAASAAAPRALRARVCRVADSSPRPSTTSFFVRQIPSRFSTCWRIFLARRMPSSPRRCARHPPRR